MTTDPQDLTLILGGTGKTGSRVARRLRAEGRAVRIGARSAAPRFDWDDRRTWGPALDGAHAVYIAFAPDLAVPGAADTVGALAAEAAGRGIARLVLLSGRGEEEAQRTEQAVRAAVPTTTVVRASWFAQNFSESFLLDPVREGVVALPVDGVPEPFVDAGDIAEVAAAALTGDGHAGRTYEVTGPRLLTFADALEEIGRAAGRSIRLEPVPVDAYAGELVRHGVPSDVASLMRYLFAEVLDGRNASLAGGIREALGRDARDFSDYARETAATGVWG